MIDIFIDNKQLEISRDVDIELSLFADKTLTASEPSYNKTRISVESSAKNRAIFGFCDQIFSPEMFNQTAHTARVEYLGALIITGRVMLVNAQINGEITIDIIAEQPRWIENAHKNILRKVPLEFNEIITGLMIRNSWESPSPVKFLPVARDRYPYVDSMAIIPAIKVFTTEDYHPFVNIKTILDAIAQESGYTIESEFLESRLFKSLYMSGFYPSKDLTILNSKMNFLAGKTAQTTTTANTQGVVHTSAAISSNSLGNIVDTADTYILASGERKPGVFNNNGCFKIVNSRAAFVPVQNVSVGFEYHFVYRSDFEIISRTKLKGLNKITLDDGNTYESHATHNLQDTLAWGSSAWGDNVLLIFNFDPSAYYELSVYNVFSGTITSTRITSAKYFFWKSETFNASLYNKTAGGTRPDAVLYTKKEYDMITKNTLVDVTLRSVPQHRNANQPVFFDVVTFSGGTSGTAITLMPDTSVRPIFYANPSQGDTVNFDEIFAHSQRQIDLVRALKHLFNLRFYSNMVSKKIYIEPRDSFYSDQIVDWSEKIDTRKAVTIEDMGSDRSVAVAMLYTDFDGSVMRFNQDTKSKFARWRTSIKNTFAKEGEENCVNPLFAPTITKKGGIPQALDAYMVSVGDRDSGGDNYKDTDLNFPPKIVSYRGMTQLQNNQKWGFPAESSDKYPEAVFHRSETSYDDAQSLCFDDFEAIPGLHKYHDREFETINNGKIITAYLKLLPHEIEQIFFPTEIKKDLRAKFRLKIDSEYILCRLIAIEGFSAKESSVKCKFIKE